MNSLKHAVLTLCLAPSLWVMGQNNIKSHDSFQLQNVSIDKTEYYSDAIATANLEKYRLKNQDVTLQFKEGFSCTLLAASKLKSKGIEVNIEEYPENFKPNFLLPQFNILENGFLHAEYTSEFDKILTK